ncbi:MULTISPECIES: tetratricopeptide repeat protein [Methylocaldum]|uniref:tetratricopeptide repeat protein n=1 Tax=unclassified Methylocaldum TaxID=2622260 RepID=UPI00105DBDF8
MPHCDIFICYDHVSAATPALALYRYLRRYFHPERIVVEHWDARPESSRIEQLKDYIRQSRVILFLITGDGSNKAKAASSSDTDIPYSDLLLHELSLNSGKTLIPILYGGTPTSREFAIYNPFHWTGTENESQLIELARLITTATGIAASQQNSDASPPPSPGEHDSAARATEPIAKAVRASIPPLLFGTFQGNRIGEPSVQTFLNRAPKSDDLKNVMTLQREAESLWLAGDFIKARILQEMALDACCRTLGKEHPDTLTALCNLAEMFWALGNLDEAKVLHQQVLDVRRYVLGDRHPDTTAAAWNLFLTLTQSSDHAAAGHVIQQYLSWLQDSAPELLSPEQQRIRDMIRQFFA